MRSYNIRELMKERGITQASLASHIGMSQASVSNIINGANTSEDVLRNIASVLDVPFETLTSPVSTNICPRCDSKAVVEWFNHGNGNCRIHCAYCGADTGEQKDREHALRIFASFSKLQNGRVSANVYILPLAELLDTSCADADDVRPTWFENRGLFIVPALVQYGMAERELELVKVLWFDSMTPKSYLLSNYGEAWRCWNKKPTAEHAEAEPWRT